MAKYASSETALHPALERAWNEASACLARGGTFLLRTGPGYTNLLPIPAWRLRQFGAAELYALAGGAGATALGADSLEAAGAPAADACEGGADATSGRTPAALAARRARRARQKAKRRSEVAAAHAELAKAAARAEAKAKAETQLPSSFSQAETQLPSSFSPAVSASSRSDCSDAALPQHEANGAVEQMETETISYNALNESCSSSTACLKGGASLAEDSLSGNTTQKVASSRATSGAAARRQSNTGSSSTLSPPRVGAKRMRRTNAAKLR